MTRSSGSSMSAVAAGSAAAPSPVSWSRSLNSISVMRCSGSSVWSSGVDGHSGVPAAGSSCRSMPDKSCVASGSIASSVALGASVGCESSTRKSSDADSAADLLADSASGSRPAEFSAAAAVSRGGIAGTVAAAVSSGGLTGAAAEADPSKCSMPLKISLQAPQRTSPARNFNWSFATRKVV